MTTAGVFGGNQNRHKKSSLAMAVLAGLLLVTLAFVVWQMLFIEGMVLRSPELVATGLQHARKDDPNRVSLDAPGDKARQASDPAKRDTESKLRAERANKPKRPSMTSAIFDENQWKDRSKLIADVAGVVPNSCGYSIGLKNLTQEELHPVAGKRHMITPPKGGKLSLVCCETTKGNLAMVAHHRWAPLGAKLFLEMVTSGYFDSTVPMMRCLKGFLCQFGLNSDPEVSKKFGGSIQDDPNWLPEGPNFRENKDGVMRFAKGYLAYAGGGKNTRGNQLIMSLEANGPLAGGSPWEVPWGELVGKESFVTLSKLYTGYGEDGPSQGKLHNRGMDEDMRKEFPKIDYINSCVLVDEMETS
ncbi:unnamed protein product [Pseudo-nitzschia multistriata]|uniref:PPIase cyclophilin-type domain-containing protein n=1 Tax=Pseudo-nitzschia multistriata TaxID=183589 RepID=A0A448ZSB1_9STRA|nr:unnamed protein product [Pseudo-nitzschia multistriata]